MTCTASSYEPLKAAIDRFVSLTALVALAPFLAGIALLIRWESPGPALFRQVRTGRNGRPFSLLKFRTMRTNVDPYGDSPRRPDDPRFTRVGRILRETSLDELPQLVNVLRSDMSLVGPRPLYPADRYGAEAIRYAEHFAARLRVRPGLTGLAQIQGRAGLTLEEKLDHDLRYVKSASLRLDLWIIYRTLRALFARTGIYEVRYARTSARRLKNDGGDDEDEVSAGAP